MYIVFLGAGLLWKSGVRRSTRIRTRPLEYWKGERLLYGRIHESEYSRVNFVGLGTQCHKYFSYYMNASLKMC